MRLNLPLTLTLSFLLLAIGVIAQYCTQQACLYSPENIVLTANEKQKIDQVLRNIASRQSLTSNL